MLDINIVRKNPKIIKKMIKDRNEKHNIDLLIELDKKKRALLKKIEDLRSRQNNISENISKSLGKEKQKLILESKGISKRIKEFEPRLEKIEDKYRNFMMDLPNIPLKDVPKGKDEKDNVILRNIGKPKKFDFNPKDHLKLGESLDIINIKKAAIISGTRFGYLKREAALLEVAIIKYAFDTLTSGEFIKYLAKSVGKDCSKEPFIPVFPPVIIKPEIFRKMARLSKEDKDERYYIERDDKYLIGSAEHTLGPMHINEIIKEKEMPIRYVGFSTNFRREAGSYGKDTRGIMRVHQFDKLEMESFTLPEHSEKEQEFFVAIQEYFMKQLKIPYRVVSICTGDMGKPDARQYDIEAWLPGQGMYRETHTADLMTDYQARRLKTRVKRNNGKKEFVHMNDATVFAIGRTIIAIIENYQKKDGSVEIPLVLRPYMGNIKKIG